VKHEALNKTDVDRSVLVETEQSDDLTLTHCSYDDRMVAELLITRWTTVMRLIMSYTPCFIKKQPGTQLPITSANVDRVSKFFHRQTQQ